MSRGTGAHNPAAVLHVFRVEEGLGNACLLTLPDGSFGFIDWGTQNPGALDAAVELVDKGRIRFVLATHAHRDHTLGIKLLLERFWTSGNQLDRFVFPATTNIRRNDPLNQAREFALEHGIPMSSDVSVSDLQRNVPPWLAFDDSWEVRILAPATVTVGSAEARAMVRAANTGNNTSCVVLFRFISETAEQGFGRALLPGDATRGTLQFARARAAEFAGLELDNQCFVVPHHGSAEGTPDWLLDCLHGLMIVSGPDNSRHHPSAITLKSLALRQGSAGSRFLLYCTSYALACGIQFGKEAGPNERHLVKRGPCFGDVSIAIPRGSPAAILQTSQDGAPRRKFGHCGRKAPAKE